MKIFQGEFLRNYIHGAEAYGIYVISSQNSKARQLLNDSVQIFQYLYEYNVCVNSSSLAVYGGISSV